MKKDISIYLDILNNIKTVQDANVLTQEIDTLTQELFESEKTTIREILNSVSAGFTSGIIRAFAENNLDINNRHILIEFLKALRALIKKPKPIKIVLAFDPSREIVEKLYNFIKDNLGDGYILDIESSEDILGGAIISFEGKYSDGSLKKSIEDVFEKEIRNTIGSAK